MPAGSTSGIKLHPHPYPSKKEKAPIPLPTPAGEGSSGDAALSNSRVLSREEVIRRRSHRAKQLLRVYQRHYWALAEGIRVKHRDYYWENGRSPVEAEEGNVNGDDADRNENGERKGCGFSSCKSKAMPLTKFCHQHILSDGKQKLYKACVFVTKSAQNLHLTCGKPVFRATVPSLCPLHYQKVQTQISKALKKATGVTSSSKSTPKFHAVIAECVREIQARRRKAVNATGDSDKIKKVG